MLRGKRAVGHVSRLRCNISKEIASSSKLRSRIERRRTIAHATESEEQVFDENINPYCSLDESGAPLKKKRTLGEMEQEYLDALRQFYFSENPSLSDEEFDILKNELLWEGSKVVTMTKEEQLFLEATKAYTMGKPILSDDEFNKLKIDLKEQGSQLAIAGPRCSLRSRRVYTDLGVDYLRLTALNLPGVALALGGFFLVDFVTGFRLTEFVELPEPVGFIAVWLVVLPILYILSDSLTKLVVRDALILKGQCTNCGETQVIFFGNILGVEGNEKASDVVCDNCKTRMYADSVKRELTQVTDMK